ncbi:ABC transporter permease [Profundibacterium mesophilum]|uniref:ABC efflux transporter n=1 Tax=Profundibacterium mesophilum KAUST100406-0324 TaxID=1037889 RepID=A0A921NUB5_9RHOB|nr:FtsX-like permease family protein [Profundibacterium mesophilum]KAF0675708.1 putative ABC efflux transporter [Profundibacterium mesophilum KAUST100406-0324]
MSGGALRIAARIAARELRGGLAGFRVFLACLALGIAAIAAVGSVRESIEAGLAREGAALLGGDAEIELTYRFATPRERRGLAQLGTVSEIVDFRSMAVVGTGPQARRALTEIKGVDDAYPLYGEMRLDPAMSLDAALDGDGRHRGAAMAPELAARLSIAPGDVFALGEREFVLMALIEAEPDNAISGFEIGPRTMVRSSALEGSGLLAPGTLFDTEYRLRLPPQADLDAAKAEAAAFIEDGGYRWRDRRNGAPGAARFIERLSAFLVLVGLAGLAVGGVGVGAAVRAHLEEKTEVIAVLKTLGASGRVIFLVYAMQIGALSLLGAVIGVVLGGGVPLLLAPLIEARLPVPAVIALHPGPLVAAAVYGLLAAAIFTLWPLAQARDLRAAALFRGMDAPGRTRPRIGDVALVASLVAVLVGLAAALSGMAQLTLYAALGLGLTFAALLGLAALMRRAARRASRSGAVRGRPALRLALGAIGGPGGEAGSVILSLGLGLTVLAAVGQIDANLRGAIARELPKVAPSYFMIDIQPAQTAAFGAMLEAEPGVSRVETAPMLRGILTDINGRPAAEVAGDHWVLRGDRGISYAAEPPEGTRITAGTWWDESEAGAEAQVSFAAEEAAEMGIGLGDLLTVNVLGRDIEARITSLREVDFSNAGIGFVMVMNPSALAGAPHSSIATVYADPQAEARILSSVGEAFPNITAISVRDAIERVGDVLAGVAAAITYGALATLVTGGVVLLGTAAAGTRARVYEAAILRTVGAARGAILASLALRWAILGAAAGVVAALAGAGAGWAVSHYVMETRFVFAPWAALAVIGGGVALTLLAGLAFAWRPLAARPAQVLRAHD